MSDVARELGCGSHTVMDAVVAVGEQLVDHRGRKDDPIERVRRRLSIAAERLTAYRRALYAVKPWWA